MAEVFIKVTATNITDGPRIFNSAPQVILPAGASTEGEVSITPGELESMRTFGQFEIVEAGASKAPTEPGPLDGSVEDLNTHLATMDDADEVQKLIDAETAGKSRKGALAALEARRDELLA